MLSTVSTLYRLLLFATNFILLVKGSDIFCGELDVHEQQRFGKDSIALSSQQTADLKQCLELCCGIPNCDGVSFSGFIIAPQTSQPNCLFVSCKRQCQLNDKSDISDGDGVVSVILKRHVTSNETLQIPDIITDQQNISGHPFPETPWISSPPVHSSSQPTVNQADTSISLAPVWIVGLAIVIAVVCIGLNLSLLSAYICYKRKQSKKRKAQITSNKGPTLHAYNPTI